MPGVEEPSDRLGDFVVVPPETLTVGSEHIQLVAELFGAAESEQVAGVCILGDHPQRLLLPRAANQNRRVRFGEHLWAVDRLGQGEELAVDGGAVAIPHPQDDLERFFELLEPLGQWWIWEAESECFAFIPACADAQPGSATGKDVKGGDGLGEVSGMAVVDAGDQGSEPDPLGDSGEVREGGVALEHGVVGGADHRLQLEEVVHHPDRVKPRSVGCLADGSQRRSDSRITTRPGEVGDLNTRLHRTTWELWRTGPVATRAMLILFIPGYTSDRPWSARYRQGCRCQRSRPHCRFRQWGRESRRRATDSHRHHVRAGSAQGSVGANTISPAVATGR